MRQRAAAAPHRPGTGPQVKVVQVLIELQKPPPGVAVPGFFVLPTSPPPMESLGSPLDSLLLSSTRELTSTLALDPAVLSCGSLLTAVTEVKDQARPWGWLCPLQETTPPTQVRQ